MIVFDLMIVWPKQVNAIAVTRVDATECCLYNPVFSSAVGDNESAGAMKTQSITFDLDHVDQDWQTNAKQYTFAPKSSGSVTATVTKYFDRHFEVQFKELHFSHTFKGVLPAASTNPVYIDLTWREEINLFVNGHVISCVPYESPKPSL